MLWTGAMYLAEKGKNHLLLSIPAVFMTAICFTYLLVAPNKNGGLFIDTQVGYIVGLVISAIVYFWFLRTARLKRNNQLELKTSTFSK